MKPINRRQFSAAAGAMLLSGPIFNISARQAKTVSELEPEQYGWVNVAAVCETPDGWALQIKDDEAVYAERSETASLLVRMKDDRSVDANTYFAHAGPFRRLEVVQEAHTITPGYIWISSLVRFRPYGV